MKHDLCRKLLQEYVEKCAWDFGNCIHWNIYEPDISLEKSLHRFNDYEEKHLVWDEFFDKVKEFTILEI